MAYLAALHQLIQNFQGFLDGGHCLVFTVAIAQFAEEVGVTVRPVQLVQVDIVGAQPFQAAFQCLSQVLPVKTRFTAADMGQPVTGAADLGGQYHPVAALA